MNDPALTLRRWTLVLLTVSALVALYVAHESIATPQAERSASHGGAR